MTRILITGGAGFIGSHVLVALHEAGFDDVVVVDDLRRSGRPMIDGVRAITGIYPLLREVDVTDRRALAAVFAADGPFDLVLHLAAYKSVRESMVDPVRYFANNVGSMLSLLEAMAEHACRRLVFSSSCTVYGQAEGLPVDEDTPHGRPLSPYGASKQICEQMICDVTGTDTGRSPTLSHAISLRYFNPAGAHASGWIGELPGDVPDSLVPFVVQAAAGVRGPLQVFGADYPTPDGTALRDYLHVVDLADAHVAAVRWALGDRSGREVVNLGAGHGHSVLEVIAAFERATGVAVPHSIAPRRPGDVAAIWSSATKAEKLLSWRACQSLEEILASAWVWQKHLDSGTA